MQIVYIHHGHRNKTYPPSQEDGLTEIGEKDTLLTAEILKDLKVKAKPVAIYTSQFYRCTRTAENINKYLGLPIIVDNRLDEFRSVHGESWTDCLNRVSAVIDDIIDKYNDDETVLCVTSGVNLSAFICRSFGVPITENVPMTGVPSCSTIGFEIKKTSK